MKTRHSEIYVHIKFEENGARNIQAKIRLEIRKRQKGLMRWQKKEASVVVSGYTNASHPFEWVTSTSVP